MQDSQALKDKGNQCFASNDFANAISFYSQAIKVDPNNHILYSNRSAAYLQVGEYQNALEDAHKCVKLDPAFLKGIVRLGDAQLQLSQFDDAISSYSSCLTSSDKTITKLAASGQQNVKIKSFYTSRIAGLGVEPKYVSETRGKGLFAARDFKKGDNILQEDSLIMALDPECAKNIACDHCMCFVEPVESQVTRCKLKLSNDQRANLQKCEVPKPVICPGCNAIYCSAACYDTAKNLYHTKMCVPDSKSEHPLNIYRNLPMVKTGPTSTTFMLVARIFATIATNLTSLSHSPSTPSHSDSTLPPSPSTPPRQLNLDTLLGPFRLFQRESLMKLQPSYNGSNLALLQSHLSHPLKLLKDAMFSELHDNFQSFIDTTITEQLFDEILGMVSMNNTSAYVLPPIFYHINVRQTDIAHARAHGMCLFTLHSCINHSCNPNAENRSTKDDRVTTAKVIVRAIKPIKKGEELLITYIDETQTKAERQQELKAKYGFTCTCSKCQ